MVSDRKPVFYGNLKKGKMFSGFIQSFNTLLHWKPIYLGCRLSYAHSTYAVNGSHNIFIFSNYLKFRRVAKVYRADHSTFCCIFLLHRHHQDRKVLKFSFLHLGRKLLGFVSNASKAIEFMTRMFLLCGVTVCSNGP